MDAAGVQHVKHVLRLIGKSARCLLVLKHGFRV